MSSTVVPGRGSSSAVARPQPCCGSRSAIGTRSGVTSPLASALAYLAWLATPYASARSLVRCGKRSCRFSAVDPMTRAVESTSFSATKRGLGSAPSPMGWWPMCSRPPASVTSWAPIAMADAVVVTAVMAPAHMRSIAKPGTDFGRPASTATLRPSVRPWSPVWVVAASATSSMRSTGSSGRRRSSSRTAFTARSSARVLA
ncbi:hypothetical protein D3C74_343650 [compost metagenome]